MNSNRTILSRLSRGRSARRGDASAWAVGVWCLFVVAMAVLALVRPGRPITHMLMLGAWYLVLFNPRTEEGSYLSIAVLTTLAAVVEHHRPRAGALPMLLGFAVVGMGLHFYGGWFYRPTQMWLKQALTLALLSYPVWLVVARRSLLVAAAPPREGALPSRPVEGTSRFPSVGG